MPLFKDQNDGYYSIAEDALEKHKVEQGTTVSEDKLIFSSRGGEFFAISRSILDDIRVADDNKEVLAAELLYGCQCSSTIPGEEADVVGQTSTYSTSWHSWD